MSELQLSGMTGLSWGRELGDENEKKSREFVASCSWEFVGVMPRKLALSVALLHAAACTAWVVPVPARALPRTAAPVSAPGPAFLPLQAGCLRSPIHNRASVHRRSAPGGDAEVLQETVRRLRRGMQHGPLLLLPPPPPPV